MGDALVIGRLWQRVRALALRVAVDAAELSARHTSTLARVALAALVLLGFGVLLVAAGAAAEPLVPVAPVAPSTTDAAVSLAMQAATAVPGGAAGVVLLGLILRPALVAEVRSAVVAAFDSPEVRAKVAGIVREEVSALPRARRRKTT